MSEIEKEILGLLRQLTPSEKQQFIEICKTMSAQNIGKPVPKEEATA